VACPSRGVPQCSATRSESAVSDRRHSVDLTHKDRRTVERFEAEVAALDEVIEVRRMWRVVKSPDRSK